MALPGALRSLQGGHGLWLRAWKQRYNLACTSSHSIGCRDAGFEQAPLTNRHRLSLFLGPFLSSLFLFVSVITSTHHRHQALAQSPECAQVRPSRLEPSTSQQMEPLHITDV